MRYKLVLTPRIQDRTRSVQNGVTTLERGNDEHPEATIVPMLRVGMQFVTPCVTSSC
ncbi:hypothetical protein ALR00_02852, partial [Pseudomonas savastanoi pv. retacarpa]